MYSLPDYQYNLPESNIAQLPSNPADHSKLLLCNFNNLQGYTDNTQINQSTSYVFEDTHFFSLPSIVSNNSVFFLNNTRVIQARVSLQNVHVVTEHGREVLVKNWEIFFLQKHSEYDFEALITLLKRTRLWTKIYFNDLISLEIIALTDKWVKFHITWSTVDDFLATYGELPLPPYITPTKLWQEHYQTIFAQKNWSVAAPTASLHFTQNILDKFVHKWIATEYVTLHVGLGTFKPVDTDDIRDYTIHEEMIIIPPELFAKIATYKRAGKNIIAVGTTVTRLLETLPYIWYMMRHRSWIYDSIISSMNEVDCARWDSISAGIKQEQQEKYILSCDSQPDGTLLVRTKIFIYPWFIWRIIDSLITNFHVPWSSLLMLVAAAMWYENMIQAYKYALSHDYKFLSFGDAMWIQKI